MQTNVIPRRSFTTVQLLIVYNGILFSGKLRGLVSVNVLEPQYLQSGKCITHQITESCIPFELNFFELK